MDFQNYEQQAHLWTPEMLKEQYTCVIDCREMCWYNAEDSYGKEREHWYDEYNDCKQQAKILEKVAEERGIEL